jgi:hypothetical protein
MKKMNKIILKNRRMMNKMKEENKNLTTIMRGEIKINKTMIILIQRRIIIKMGIHSSPI